MEKLLQKKICNMEKLTAKETEERVKAIIRLAKAIKSGYEKKTKQTFPIIKFIILDLPTLGCPKKKIFFLY